MSETPASTTDAGRIREAIDRASNGLVERRGLVELAVLSAVAKEHMLVIGPPGTAKSEVVRRVAAALGGSYFEYLLSRFTEPSEIFGAIDIARLADGVVETRTANMLPEADFVFLDEVFFGSSAILNTLLGILNERVFRRGHTLIECPLRLCVAASNTLPRDDVLAAFADRFLVHVFIEPVPDSLLEELLSAGWTNAFSDNGGRQPAVASPEILERLSAQCAALELGAVRGAIAHALRQLRQAGIYLSDRRLVKAQKLIAGAAVLAGRTHAAASDLWPLVYAIPDANQQLLARDVLGDLLDHAANPLLGAAVGEIATSVEARATRLEQRAADLLDGRPNEPAGQAFEGWRAQVEALAREIDAGFAREAMPTGLASLRGDLVRWLDPR
ncbi:MAG: AAA family ATPase [Myxococcales bacterium]|nr:AAA family ATPase [Myxococcales bacterium]